MNRSLRTLCVTAAFATALGCAHEEKKAAPPPPIVQAPPPQPPAPTTTPDAEFRAQKPAPLPVTLKFQAPQPTERKLKNGAVVLVNENHALPLVAVEVVIKAATNDDPLAKAGLADMVAGMLDEGTKKHSALELDAALEDLAAELSANAGLETTRIHLNCLKETLPQCLELLAEVVTEPTFKPEDLERVRKLQLAALEQKKGSPPALAADQVARLLYGPKHPWGQPAGGTPATIKAITRNDLVKFHDTYFRPNNAIIGVSGDVNTDEIVSLLDQRFGAWKAKPVSARKLPAVPALTRSITVVDKPGASQSQVYVAGRMFKANDPDAVPVRVANYALGGLFTSRLNMNLREDKAYSYGVHSGVSLMRDTGTFTAGGGIVAPHTADAVVEYEKELSRFSDGQLTDEELTRSKEAFIRSLPSVLETNDAVASAIGGLVSLGLPLDYYATLPGRVQAVTQADVQKAVQAHFKPDQWPVVIVGPKQVFQEGLSKLTFGPVTEKPVAQTE